MGDAPMVGMPMDMPPQGRMPRDMPYGYGSPPEMFDRPPMPYGRMHPMGHMPHMMGGMAHAGMPQMMGHMPPMGQMPPMMPPRHMPPVDPATMNYMGGEQMNQRQMEEHAMAQKEAGEARDAAEMKTQE